MAETCRLRNRSPFQYPVELMQAKFNHQPAPALLYANYNTISKAAGFTQTTAHSVNG